MHAKPLLALAISVAAPLAGAQQVFVVDDFAGPGVDFTDIGAAVAAVPAGSVLQVLDGIYAPFVLDKPLSIHGDPLARVIEGTTVTGIPFGTRAVVTGLELTTPDVCQNAGAVIFEDVLFTDLLVTGWRPMVVFVESSADVRFHRSTIVAQNPQFPAPTDTEDGVHALVVDGSRVEVADSTLVGGKGACGLCDFQGTPGGDGVVAGTGSRVHVALSDVSGGDGGDSLVHESFYNSGDGGNGIVVESGAEVVVSGIATDVVTGANAGSQGIPFPGMGGSGIVVAGGDLRVSGVTLDYGCVAPGSSDPCAPYMGEQIELQSGTVNQPAPPDASLAVLGDALPGQLLTWRLYGEAGDLAFLILGRTPIVLSLPGVEIELLTNPLRRYALGPIPAGGQLDVALGISGALPTGMTLIGQGEVVTASGETQLTNSTPLSRE